MSHDAKDMVEKLEGILGHRQGTARTDAPTASYKALRKKWWKKLGATNRATRDLVFQKEKPEDRSEGAWRVGHALIEAHVPPNHAFVLLRGSVWNKFAGRDDEVSQLWACIPTLAGAERRDVGPGTEGEGFTATLEDLSLVDMVPNWWLWDDRIPLGELTLLGAKQGTGKSQLAAWLIAQVTTGKLPGEFQDVPKDCLICVDEESLSKTVVPRLRASGADMSRVKGLSMRNPGGIGRPLALPEDIPMVKDVIRRSGAKLMILDTLSGFIVGGQKFDSHNEHHVRKALGPLANMAQECEIAVIGTMHLRKDQGGTGDMMMSFLGSVGYTAVSRSALGMTYGVDGPESDERLVHHVKSNYSKLQHSLRFETQSYNRLRTRDGLVVKTSRMVLMGDADVTYEDLMNEVLVGAREGARTSARKGLEEALLHAVADGNTLTVSDSQALAKEFGISGRHVFTICSKLKLERFWEDGVKCLRLPNGSD